MARVLDATLTVDPGRAALVIDERPVSYAELEEASARAASALVAAGARPGTRVPVVDDASLLSVAAVLGAARIGAAASLMNPRLTTSELAALATTSTPRSEDASPPTGENRPRPVAAVAGERYAASVAEAMGVKPLCRLPGDVDETAQVRSARVMSPSSDDEALVLFTSGTTGLPKAVPLTHGTISPRIATFAKPVVPGREPEVSIMCVPLVHIGGMLGLLVALASGTTTVVQQRFDAGEWLALVERHGVTRAFLVPTMLHRILAHPDFGRRDLSSLVLLSYGAAPAPPELVSRAVQALPGVSFSNVFGQTETLGSITALGPEDHLPGAPPHRLASVGRALPGFELRVADPEGASEDPLPDGTIGELIVRTEGEDGWTRTGDLVSRDADGYFYAHGRMSETINRGGEKFPPGEVEEVLCQHPLVEEAAVAAVPDPEMGSRVGAAVVASGPIDLDELRRHCRDRIASFKAPEILVLVEELPYNDTGKVARQRLAEVISAGSAR